MNARKQFTIENGPSSSALFDACKYAYDPNGAVRLDFKVAIAYTGNEREMSGYIAMQLKDVRVVGIEHEDGTGHRFNLYGYCKADLEALVKENAVFKSYQFRAFYNAKSRHGWIDFFS